MKNIGKLFFALVVMVSACDEGNPRIEYTGPPHSTQSQLTTDGKSGGVSILTNTTRICGVKILWDYTNQVVIIKNESELDIQVSIRTYVDYFWQTILPGAKAVTSMSFHQGDTVLVHVYQMCSGRSGDKCLKWVLDDRRAFYALGK